MNCILTCSRIKEIKVSSQIMPLFNGRLKDTVYAGNHSIIQTNPDPDNAQQKHRLTYRPWPEASIRSVSMIFFILCEHRLQPRPGGAPVTPRGYRRQGSQE